jgi:hypothetical protein
MGFNSCRNKENPRTASVVKKARPSVLFCFHFFQCSVSWICVFVSPVFVWSLSWYLRFTFIYRGFVILLVKSATNKAGLHRKTWQRLNFNRHIIPFRRSNMLLCLRKSMPVCLEEERCIIVPRKRHFVHHIIHPSPSRSEDTTFPESLNKTKIMRVHSMQRSPVQPTSQWKLWREINPPFKVQGTG